jgi:hypothetical protein
MHSESKTSITHIATNLSLCKIDEIVLSASIVHGSQCFSASCFVQLHSFIVISYHAPYIILSSLFQRAERQRWQYYARFGVLRSSAVEIDNTALEIAESHQFVGFDGTYRRFIEGQIGKIATENVAVEFDTERTDALRESQSDRRNELSKRSSHRSADVVFERQHQKLGDSQQRH